MPSISESEPLLRKNVEQDEQYWNASRSSGRQCDEGGGDEDNKQFMSHII